MSVADHDFVIICLLCGSGDDDDDALSSSDARGHVACNLQSSDVSYAC